MIETFTIGRANCDIIIQDDKQSISKLHAELTISADGMNYYLVDCGSSNGTFISQAVTGGADKWEQIKQAAVKVNETVRFGTLMVQMKDLIRQLPQRTAPTPQNQTPVPAKTSLQPYRNPETGQIEYR